MPRKKIDKLVAFAKDYGAKGLAYIAIQEDGTVKSSFAKFMTDEQMKALIDAMGGENGDLLLLSISWRFCVSIFSFFFTSS